MIKTKKSILQNEKQKNDLARLAIK